MIAHVSPDIVVLQDIDWDAGGAALGVLADRLEEMGASYPHRYAARPNSGMATGLDMDGDGRLGRARDAQGYGRFAGQGGLAVLSRLPILEEGVRDFSGMLWSSLPGAMLPMVEGEPFPSAEAAAIQRLSSVAHWDVPVALPDGRALHLLTWHATPPVFDGPEDRNGLRNHDEAAIWLRYLDGALDVPPPEAPFVLIGNANLDTEDGDGRPGAMRALLDDPRLRDPAPSSEGGIEAARRDGGANTGQGGDPALDTADWRDGEGDPGNLRVSYVLPSADLEVTGSGVFWPPEGAPETPILGDPEEATRHRLVWVDVALPDQAASREPLYVPRGG